MSETPCNIAIITAKDTVWALPCWWQTVPVLKENGYTLSGIWLTDDRLARHTGKDIPLWYLKTFGLCTFIKLGIFSVLRQALCLLKGMSFQKLGQKHNFPVLETESPNEERVVSWLQENNIDIALIMTPFIIKEPFIKAVNIGVINKHAALLPANKGLFPYFWAQLKNEPQGVSYHQVDTGIDTGKILIQYPVTEKSSLKSMLSFYLGVFKDYPQRMNEAVKALIKKDYKSGAAMADSYQSLPTASDYKSFTRSGGIVASWRDVISGGITL